MPDDEWTAMFSSAAQPHPQGLYDGLDAALVLALDLVAQPEDRDDECDVGFDGCDYLAGRYALLANDGQKAVARLG